MAALVETVRLDSGVYVPAASFFGGRTSYDAASRTSSEMAAWRPTMKSPDSELLPERDLMLSRQRDAIRNNGIGAGYAQSRLDAVIGAGLRLLPRPDWRALGQTAEWADEWQRIVKSQWRQYADDVDCWIDWKRRCKFNTLLAQAYRSYIFHSEMIAVLEWRQDKRGAFARTAVNIVHPDLLCNPNDEPDTWTRRAGVEMDSVTREPIGYWFRQVHRSEDASTGAPSYAWKYVPRYTAWGRQQVIHVYEVEQPDQTRGKPTFAAALLRLRMLDKFEKTALEAQIIQAMYAAIIESSAAHSDVMGAMGGLPSAGGSGTSPLGAYTDAQVAWNKQSPIIVGGVKVPHLLAGERLEFKTPGNVAPTLDAFEHATLLHLSRALPGVSYEELSGDYSRTNYSSARAASITPWRFITGQRDNIAAPLATGIYAGLLEELLDDGRVPTPANAPSFYEAKTAWIGCKWIGAPRGHIDEEKEQNARKLKREAGTLTHEDDCAENGQDSDEVIDRLAMEHVKFKNSGLESLLPNAAITAKAAANAQAAPAPSPAASNDQRDRQENTDAGR